MYIYMYIDIRTRAHTQIESTQDEGNLSSKLGFYGIQLISVNENWLLQTNKKRQRKTEKDLARQRANYYKIVQSMKLSHVIQRSQKQRKQKKQASHFDYEYIGNPLNKEIQNRGTHID